MNLTIDRSRILPALTLASNVVEKRQTLPILSNLYFELNGGTLLVMATDLEVEISQPLGEVEGTDGSFTVSMQKILDIVRMLPENSSISFKQDKGKIIVTSGRSRYVLRTLPSDEFPRIEAGNWEERFKINQLSLKSLLAKTSFAMGVQDFRHYLNGVLFELTGNQLRTIATDGHRLAQSDADIELNLSETRELIVPRKGITEIQRFIGDGEDADLTLEMNEKHLKLSKHESTLVTKLIDGKFPEFKGVLENEPDIVISVNRAEFIDSLNRAAVLTTTNDRFRGIKANLETGVLRILAHNMEQEEGVEEIEVEYDGDAVEAGYNVVYLTDAARAAESETVELHLQKDSGICVVKQPDDERTIWLIMPMRL